MHATLYFAEPCLFDYDILMQLAFGVVTLVVAAVAAWVYRMTEQKQVKLFSFSFLFISLSYFILSFFNFLMFTKADEAVCLLAQIPSIYVFNTVGLVLHILFRLIGILVLVYLALRIEKKELFFLLLSISFSAVFLSRDILYMFFLISSIYYLYISSYFIRNYLHNKQLKTALIALAFIFLLLGSGLYFMSISMITFYAVAHILELVAYLLILWNLYLVIRK